MGKSKTEKKIKEARRKGNENRRKRSVSPPGTPDELAIAVLTTTPKELKDWRRRQTKRR